MNLQTRKKLGLREGSKEDFTIKPVGWFGQLTWASQSADPANRVGAQLALVSMCLGALSVVISLLGIFGPLIVTKFSH